MIKAIVTDIEGTTTSIAFVHDVLFPYARQRIAAFVAEHADAPKVRVQLDAVAQLAGRALTPTESGTLLVRWIDEDRKATPLKALQGMIWAHGYAEGTLKGHVYADVPACLRRWHAAGLRLYVYSSGSVAAQKLIFGHSTAGDLTPLFSGYFDTHIGGKREAASYRNILTELGQPGAHVLFLSDVTAELDAARTAGIGTCQLLRDAADQTVADHPQARDFSEVQLG
ncbi:MAG: acireductone synthase [Nevskiaceae bacterium]|nr:MAG: acireductone synthase [Nevskiaceae bacterium]TBR72616.1 MAG: acireductone synthase [Nevskiaceae bacterium]